MDEMELMVRLDQRVVRDLLAHRVDKEALDPREEPALRETPAHRVNVDDRVTMVKWETQALPVFQDLRDHQDKIWHLRLQNSALATKDRLQRDSDCIPANDLLINLRI